MTEKPDPARTAYFSRLDMLSSRAMSLSGQVGQVSRRIYGTEELLNGLPTRIQQIRRMNYRVLSNLEKDQSALADRWASTGPGVKEIINANTPFVSSEIRVLESELAQRRMDTAYDAGRLASIEMKVAAIMSRVSDINSKVSGAMGDVESRLQQINEDVAVAERTTSLVSNASFQWKEGESPVLSVSAKDLNNDLHGFLTLTNQRFLYEVEKEIVLKKRLFIATEKKKVRETVVDKPIGAVDDITKGRVGLLAGQGLYIKLKPQTGVPEMKLDTSGEDADLVLRFNGFISSGEADRELASAQEINVEKEKPVPVVCPRCGAPYIDEIFRGQISVQCRYCSTSIPIQR